MFNWLPWKYIVNRFARAHGFVDPLALLGRLERFAHRSEVSVPIELLRAGISFHARGLLNTKAIQNNLDWVWPMWVTRQFNPRDPAFLPRAFSATHVNLTHRNWTALGLPGFDQYALVDPHGLVTPFFDQWSIDCWLISDDGDNLLPSRLANGEVEQNITPSTETLMIETNCSQDSNEIMMQGEVLRQGDGISLHCRYSGKSDKPGWLVVSLRPCNPEGIAKVENIAFDAAGNYWLVNGEEKISLSAKPDRTAFSDYQKGDVYNDLPQTTEMMSVTCPAGLATSALLFRLDGEGERNVELEINLTSSAVAQKTSDTTVKAVTPWEETLEPACKLSVADTKIKRLFDTAVQTLVLLSPGDAYPGSYTYKRFWFRDAAFMLNAMLAANLPGRVEKGIAHFAERQGIDGYFRSQEGEWDANGEAMWIMDQYCRMTMTPPPRDWQKMITRGADWIIRKRISESGKLHDGLLPPGFSAEHLGNNDYYYWDDWWGVAGLESAAQLYRQWNMDEEAARYDQEARDFRDAIAESLARAREQRQLPGYPAGPHRRMDAGAIGSIVAGYPLRLLPPRDENLLGTVEYLLQDRFIDDAFFQDMIHSGFNAYLTLHVAQVLLRAGDERYLPLINRIAELASPTGQWPEAIHPATGGGCMGDGQHGWAAAEWVMMIRNLFVREEGNGLVLGSGIPQAWLDGEEGCSLGPTLTSWGALHVSFRKGASGIEVSWQDKWQEKKPELIIALAGMEPRKIVAPENKGQVLLPESS